MSDSVDHLLMKSAIVPLIPVTDASSPVTPPLTPLLAETLPSHQVATTSLSPANTPPTSMYKRIYFLYMRRRFHQHGFSVL